MKLYKVELRIATNRAGDVPGHRGRYVASNCQPDHDTICAFRRNNFEAVAKAFEQVLLLAKELKLLRVGTVSVDGTKVDANANKVRQANWCQCSR